MNEDKKCDCAEFNPELKKSIIELALYALFLSTTCIVAFGNVGSSLYFCTDMISKTFIEKTFRSDLEAEMSFLEISSINEFWQFTQTVLLEGFHSFDNHQYNDKLARLLKENILLGSVRIRQLRVKNDTCDVHPHFAHIFSDCFDFYSSSAEDKNSFGLQGGSAWTHHSQDELQGYKTWGKFQSYFGGGFYQDLDASREKAELNIRSLYENGWIDRGTRVVFIEFTIYNPNSNVFCFSKLIVEILPTGGLIPSVNSHVLKLIRFRGFSGIFIGMFGVVFVVQIIVYTWMKVFQMTKHRVHYFYNLWNILDIFIILISYFAIGFSIFREIYIDEKMKTFKDEPKKYISFDVISFWLVIFLDFLGVCVGLVWIRMLKFVKFSSTMLQFGKTLARCAGDVAGFGLMFFIVFVAYAQLGFILFGSEIKDFQTVFASIFTLMRTILGDFDYLAIEKANRVLGPIYFMSYIFFVFFVLLNIFLAIINDTYEEIKSEDIPEVLPFSKYVKKKLSLWAKRAKVKVQSRKWSISKTSIVEGLDESLDDIRDQTSRCMSCQDKRENIEAMNEKIFALENEVNQFVMKFSEVVNTFFQLQKP